MCGRILPPFFSDCLLISLKSLTQIQGTVPLAFKLRNLAHNSCLFLRVWFTIKAYESPFILCILLIMVSIWFFEKVSILGSKSSFQNNTYPPALFLLRTIDLFFHLIWSWNFVSLASYVHVFAINRIEGSCTHTIFANWSSVLGFLSPRQFQHIRLMASIRVGNQPPPLSFYFLYHSKKPLSFYMVTQSDLPHWCFFLSHCILHNIIHLSILSWNSIPLRSMACDRPLEFFGNIR